jgi:YVTN family beta-propeller protein
VDFAYQVAVSLDGKRAYVTTSEGYNGTVSVIATATNTVVASVPIESIPLAIALSPDGTHAYVSSTDPGVGGSMTVIATATNTVVAKFPMPDPPNGLVFSPDGKRLYATSQSGTLYVLDPVTNTVLTAIAEDNNGEAVAVTPDGAHLYVDGSGFVDVIDTATNTLVKSILIGEFDTYVPDGVVVSADGERVYATDAFSCTVTVIDTATNTVVATIPLAANGGPEGLALTPDGAHLYVANYSNVSVIATATNTVVATINGADVFQTIAFPPPISVPSSGTACNGTYNGTFKGNIVVSSKQNCRWVGGDITGNVVVTGGNFANANNTIAGNVAIGGASTFSVGPGTIINGSLAIGLIPPGTTTNQVCGANVVHDFALAGNASPFQLGSPSPVSCPGNTVGGNATVDLNTAPVMVYNNSVVKSLSCLANLSITGGGNTAKPKLGQCTTF